MRLRHWHVFAAVLLIGGILVAAAPRPARDEKRLVAKGEVHYAVFRDADGKTSGWTSIDNKIAVPAASGSWNEHRYAEMYDDFLIVTKPSEKDWGTLVIPTSRLVEIHFKQ